MLYCPLLFWTKDHRRSCFKPWCPKFGKNWAIGTPIAVRKWCSEPPGFSLRLTNTVINDNHHWHSTSVSLRAETPVAYPTLAGKWSWWPNSLFHLWLLGFYELSVTPKCDITIKSQPCKKAGRSLWLCNSVVLCLAVSKRLKGGRRLLRISVDSCLQIYSKTHSYIDSKLTCSLGRRTDTTLKK